MRGEKCDCKMFLSWFGCLHLFKIHVLCVLGISGSVLSVLVPSIETLVFMWDVKLRNINSELRAFLKDVMSEHVKDSRKRFWEDKDRNSSVKDVKCVTMGEKKKQVTTKRKSLSFSMSTNQNHAVPCSEYSHLMVCNLSAPLAMHWGGCIGSKRRAYWLLEKFLRGEKMTRPLCSC